MHLMKFILSMAGLAFLTSICPIAGFVVLAVIVWNVTKE